VGSLVNLAAVAREYHLADLPDSNSPWCSRRWGMLPPVVLDVGANVGHFARIALERWPGARVLCYEPNPDTFAQLAGSGVAASFTCAAVTFPRRPGKQPLYLGVHEPGECSLRQDVVWAPDATDPRPHRCQRDEWVMVDTIGADGLPPCDVLKVDTEGCEVEILQGYPYLESVSVLLVEAHPAGEDLGAQVRRIVRLARAAGLHRVSGPVLRFVR
jgi:FkbM family methyltransferase